jgi:hypothetical protein
MVPGMTERERLSASAQRLDWLSDATAGPGRLFCLANRAPTGTQQGAEGPVSRWQRGRLMARTLGCSAARWAASPLPAKGAGLGHGQ